MPGLATHAFFNRTRAAGLAALAVALHATPALAQQTTVTILTPEGSGFSYAYGVRDGQQVGTSMFNSVYRADLWNGNAASHVDLHPEGALTSVALGVGGGKQVGYVIRQEGIPEASLWSGTAQSWVNLNPSGSVSSYAWGAEGNQQVGYAGNEGIQRASLWSGTAESWVDLHPPGAAASYAWAVGTGQQVGSATLEGTSVSLASLWSGSANSWINLHPVGPQHLESVAVGVRDGQQVGRLRKFMPNGELEFRASLWTGSASSWVDLTPAGALGSLAYGVGAGQQVGMAYFPGENARASLWTGTTESWVDLSVYLPPGFITSEATGIWFDGVNTYISGFGQRDGRNEALLWTRSGQSCQHVWQPMDDASDSYPGVNGGVNAMVNWDPDGSGPRPPLVVLAGSFSIAGTVVVSNGLATYDPATGAWGELGTGTTNSPISSLVVSPSGQLFAAGDFTTIGGTPANRVARWTGSAWVPLGSGVNARVESLATLPNGDLVAAGYFNIAGGLSANKVAVWNGSAWQPLGPGITGSRHVGALAVLPTGDIVAGGSFSIANGAQGNGILRWTGSAWTQLGTGLAGDGGAKVFALAVLPNGELLAAGQFSSAGGVPAYGLARWNGIWNAYGLEPGSAFVSLAVQPNGDILAGGTRMQGGQGIRSLHRRSGSLWSSVGNNIDLPYGVLPLPNGDILAAATLYNRPLSNSDPFLTAIASIARWNGITWSPLDSGMNEGVYALKTLSNGDLIAGGGFSTGGNIVTPNGIARWNSSTGWSPIGSNMTGYINQGAIAELPNGDILVGGYTYFPLTQELSWIARFNGTEWVPFAGGTDGRVRSITVLPNGDVVVSGEFQQVGLTLPQGPTPANRIARWDGTQWHPIGSGLDGPALSMAVMPNGDLIAGGDTINFADGIFVNGVARWDGTSWSAVGTVPTGAGRSVNAVAVMPNGDLVVAGGFGVTTENGFAYGVARWDGTAWFPMGDSSELVQIFYALLPLPNGQLIATGDFTPFTNPPNKYKGVILWDGTRWTTLSGGVGPGAGGGRALAALPNGDIVVGGFFATAGGRTSPYIARGVIPLQLTITSQPSDVTGCSGDIASFTVAATGAPASFRWRKNGVPISSVDNPSAATGVLNLGSIRATDAGVYDCVVSSPCDSVTSAPATLTVLPCGCNPADIANTDGEAPPDNAIDNGDFTAFFNAFFLDQADPARLVADIANTDGDTTLTGAGPDGAVDNGDFTAFFNFFFLGCP
jgi:hypothetical protein